MSRKAFEQRIERPLGSTSLHLVNALRKVVWTESIFLEPTEREFFIIFNDKGAGHASNARLRSSP